MRIIRQLISLILVLSISSSVFAGKEALGSVQLGDESKLSFNPHIEYLEDVDANLTRERVSTIPDDQWSQVPNRSISFGFSSAAYWLRFSVTNTNSDSAFRYLLIDHPVLDDITVYEFENGALVKETKAGDLMPFENRQIKYQSFVFLANFSPGLEKQFLIRVQSEGALKLPISIWKPQALEESNRLFTVWIGVFAGILLAMSLYNTFLFVSIKDVTYLSYAVFALSVLGFFLSMEGFAYQWLWPNSPIWHSYTLVFFNAIGCIGLSLFTLQYLEPRQGSKARKSLEWLVVASFVALVGSFVLPYNFMAVYHSILDILVICACLGAALYMLGKSTERAQFFLISWSAFLIGTVTSVLSNTGVLSSLAIFNSFSMVGSVVGVIILSFALADKIRSEREAKVDAQKQAIDNYKKFYSIYENAREGIFVMDARNNIISANPAMSECLGLDTDKVISKDCPIALSQVIHERQFKQLVKELAHNEALVDFETPLMRLDGKTMWVLISAHKAKDSEDSPIYEGSVVDINDRKEFENELQHLASHDSLTGFLNRHAFEEQAKSLLACVKSTRIDAAILYLDLDQFKIVNDLCGHSAGDSLLRSLSIRLNNKLLSYGNEPIIARLGGDEFGILLPGFSLTQSQAMAEDLRQCIESFVFLWDSHRYPIGVSIGVVQLDHYHHSIEQIINMADTACYMAKDQGRNRVHVFAETDKDIELRKHELRWLTVLRDAIEQDHFFLVAQEIASNHSGANGQRYEVLLRLNRPGRGLETPNQFLPAAERYRLMPAIDRWVIRTFFAWLRDHPEHNEQLESASINLSTQSLGEASFADSLLSDFDEFGIEPEKICFEITESMAVTNMDNTHSFISRFGELGCRFALDDFGTGFSSYAYLKELAVHYIKIDGMFVRNLIVDEVDEAMVLSVHRVAEKMGIETIAEFVENEEIQERLMEIGVQFSQGFHIAKPVPLADLLTVPIASAEANRA